MCQGKSTGTIKTVYGLYSSLDPAQTIRYVGMTRRAIVEHVGQHVGGARTGRHEPQMVKWITSVLNAGGEICAINLSKRDSSRSELLWIRHLKRAGAPLLNQSNSEGVRKAWQEPEKRQRMLQRDESTRLARSRDAVQNDVTRFRMSAGQHRKEVSPEQREQIRQTLLGRTGQPLPAERVARIRTANRLQHRERRVGVDSIDAVWLRMLRDILERGAEVTPRGQRTRELFSHLVVFDAQRPVVTIQERKMGYRFMCAEAAWMLSGDNRVETIAPFNARIAQFSDDGTTFFGAYGPRIRAQLDYVVETLQRDPSSRQAVINIWRESPPASRDLPCTTSFQFVVRDNQLHVVVTMRSNDAWLGFVYDGFNASMLAGYVLLQLGQPALSLGHVFHHAVSRHLYEINWSQAAECLVTMTVGFEYMNFDPYVFEIPDQLVAHLWGLARREQRDGWLAEQLLTKRY